MNTRLLTTDCIEEIESTLSFNGPAALYWVRQHPCFAYYFKFDDLIMHDRLSVSICTQSVGPADYTPLIEQRATFLMFVLCSEGVWK